LAGAIRSVEGAKVLTAPKPGSGDRSLSIAVVELSDKATLGAVTTAVEKAQTPHRAQSEPGVAAAIPGKVKAGVTPDAIMEAIKKANLLEE
jgi:hypothetical protein